MKRIVLLTGTSSVGKTTLVREALGSGPVPGLTRLNCDDLGAAVLQEYTEKKLQYTDYLKAVRPRIWQAIREAWGDEATRVVLIDDVRFDLVSDLSDLPLEVVLLYAPLATMARNALSRPPNDERPFVNLLKQFKAMYGPTPLTAGQPALDTVSRADFKSFLAADSKTGYQAARIEKEVSAASRHFHLPTEDASASVYARAPVQLLINLKRTAFQEAATQLREYLLR